MNRAAYQSQQKEPVTSNKIKLNAKISGKDINLDNASLLDWSNLKYGLFMIAVIVIPPLIPGASVRLLIMGYMIVIVSIYAVLAIISAVRTFRPTKAPKRRKSSINYRQ